VVAEDCHRVTVLSWATGIVRAQFGSEGCGVGQVMYPCGVKLAYDGSEVTVADTWNNRLSVFSLCGTSVVTVGGRQSERNNPRWCELNNPSDVIPLAPGGDFVAASCRTLKRASRDGTTTVIHDLQFRPTALAALSNGDVVVRDGAGGYLVLHDIRLRCLWMIACTNVNRRSAAHSAHASKRGRHGKCIP
jgi:DNA-binding beta-propeller fold protein YncE